MEVKYVSVWFQYSVILVKKNSIHMCEGKSPGIYMYMCFRVFIHFIVFELKQQV